MRVHHEGQAAEPSRGSIGYGRCRGMGDVLTQLVDMADVVRLVAVAQRTAGAAHVHGVDRTAGLSHRIGQMRGEKVVVVAVDDERDPRTRSGTAVRRTSVLVSGPSS
ncbi:hypothetical protein GCM10025876_19360 [Demequina litorisediminis]|uniref:Uncharacterized protein n=1 Tax=Demequina litorisediminis TaxID=1849022 RepID=A0ABQ6IEX9_9MICO|nr:hypothetical protein GCM10025876_19360 [Demequina litorisediminis]